MDTNMLLAMAAAQSAAYNNTSNQSPMTPSALLQSQLLAQEFYRRMAMQQLMLIQEQQQQQQQQNTLLQLGMQRMLSMSSPACAPVIPSSSTPPMMPTASLFFSSTPSTSSPMDAAVIREEKPVVGSEARTESAIPTALPAYEPSQTISVAAVSPLALQRDEKPEKLEGVQPMFDLKLARDEKSIQVTPLSVFSQIPGFENLAKDEFGVFSMFASLPTPDATPSPSEDTSRPSPAASASSARHSQEYDDDDDEMFIDVEDVEDKASGKTKRKAHIEFYRKLKAIRGREKRLQCARCDETVVNNDTAVTEHVQEHAGGMCFRCQVCGWEANQRTSMYSHMQENHPRKPSAFADRRDMTKLSALIVECFPKGGAKIKTNLSAYVENLIKELVGRSIDKVKCKLCEKTLPVEKNVIARHMHSHPAYRCKTCKFTSDSVESQEDHVRLNHKIETPKVTVHYNLCTAVDAITRSFQKCFGEIL